MEEVFDDLVCLDEAGETQEPNTSGHLPDLEQRRSGTKRRSAPYRHSREKRLRPVIAEYHSHTHSQRLSSGYQDDRKPFHVTWSDLQESSVHRTKRKRAANVVHSADVALLEVDSCEGDDVGYTEREDSVHLDRPPGKEEQNNSVSHASPEVSEDLHLYGDDEDWPYLSGDVDEEAVRLAASIIPEAKNEAAEQNIRKNRDDAEHTDDKRVPEHHKNGNGSSHRSMNLDKFDDEERQPKKVTSYAVSNSGRWPTAHAYREKRNHLSSCRDWRFHHHKQMKHKRLSENRERIGRVSLFLPSHTPPKCSRIRDKLPLLYSKKTYVYPSPSPSEESVLGGSKRSAVHGIVIKRSYQRKAPSVRNDLAEDRKMISRIFHSKSALDKADLNMGGRHPVVCHKVDGVGMSKGKEEFIVSGKEAAGKVLTESTEPLPKKTGKEETPKKKLRWKITTGQLSLPSKNEANLIVHKSSTDPEADAERKIVVGSGRSDKRYMPRTSQIKLRIPDLPVIYS